MTLRTLFVGQLTSTSGHSQSVRKAGYPTTSQNRCRSGNYNIADIEKLCNALHQLQKIGGAANLRPFFVVAAVIVSATPVLAADAHQLVFRRAAWSMVAENGDKLSEQDVQPGQPFFLRRMTLTNTVSLIDTFTVLVAGMPFQKLPEPITFRKGQVFHRVFSPGDEAAIYCSPGVGYVSSKAMIGGTYRLCLADSNGDHIFDHVLLGTVWTGNEKKEAFGLVGAFLRDIDASDNYFSPMILQGRANQEISLPYRDSNHKWGSFDIGFVIISKSGQDRIGFAEKDGNAISPFMPFDASSESISPGKFIPLKKPSLQQLKVISSQFGESSVSVGPYTITI